MFYRKLWHVIAIEKRHFRGRLTNRRKDGREYVAETIISPVLDRAGNVQFFVGVERDVTREVEIDRAKLPVIILSNLGDANRIAEAMEKRTYEYMVKTDWSLDDVVRHVRETLAKTARR